MSDIRSFIVATTQIKILTAASSAEAAVKQVLDFEGAPRSALVGVYLKDPVPRVDAGLGAPMGRFSQPLNRDGKWKADRIRIDTGGYDKGGAYWGLRRPGESLYAVQDGMGNVAFVDATSKKAALAEAAA